MPDCVSIAFAAGELAPAPTKYAGLCLHSTGAAAARVRLWDNASAASGTIIADVELTASGADSWVDYTLHPSVRAVNGIFAELVSGTVEGSVRIA